MGVFVTRQLLLLLSFAAQLLVCSISNGQLDSTNAFPMVCALLFGSPAVPGGWNVTCTGTLVAPATIVTATQCAGLFTHVSCRSSVNTSAALYQVDRTERLSAWWSGSNAVPTAAGRKAGAAGRQAGGATAEDSLLVATLKRPVTNARVPLLPKAVPATSNGSYSVVQQSGAINAPAGGEYFP
jgi:hypothetical protein